MNHLLRLFATAAALSAQNPVAAANDPFTGNFQNDNMRVELARDGPAYAGVIHLAGKALPLKATADAGKLSGAFVSLGKSFRFTAARNGSQLTLTTDGVTSTLELDSPLPLFAGEWRGQTGAVRIDPDGTALIGGKPHRWSLAGNILTLTGNGETVKIPFDLTPDTWTWKLPGGQLVLTRAATGITGAWQGPSGNVQLNLDGTATVAGVPYRYTLSENKLTLTGPDGTFVAAVQQFGDAMTRAINGKTLQFQRAATTWAVGGASGVGAILPELVGKWCPLANAPSGDCLSLLADGSFQQGDDAGTWNAVESAITTTSRKAGARTLRFEKRNHPKSGVPLLVLDGVEHISAFAKSPW